MPRLGDMRLLRGRGRYLADIDVPGLLHASFVRSPHAAARILGTDLSPLSGRADVLAAADHQAIAAYLKGPIPVNIPHPGLSSIPMPALADGAVRYVGEPVAVIVARSRAGAEDAAESARVEYAPLPVVADVQAALRPGAPLVHPGLGTNLALRFHQTHGEPERAFACADVVLAETLRISRGAGQPMETRGVVALPGPDGLLVWTSSQWPFNVKRALVRVLGLPERSVHVIAPDVGGGFGSKAMLYPEEIVIPLLAIRLNRPVKWVEDRREHFQATTHEREQVHHVRLAARADGTLMALEDGFLHDSGAYTPYGAAIPSITAAHLLGPYRIPSFHIQASVVYTHRVPVTPYRGAGRPQACFVINRMLDRLAGAVGVDPVEIRRRNLLRPEELPHDTGIENQYGERVVYDTGDYTGALDRVARLASYEGFRTRQRQARQRGHYLGFGVASYVESAASGPYEGAQVTIDALGEIVLATGSASQGQGHETILAQVVADALGARPADIHVVGGDTRALPYGAGTYGSRTAVAAGNASWAAGREVRTKALRIAARLLEARPDDLDCRDGRIFVRGAPNRCVTFADAARAADPLRGNLPTELDPGLTAVCYHRPEPTYPSGAHAAVVEVDPETGAVQVHGYWAVHECGTIINPLIVDGQIAGGVAQGVGGALYEHLIYDAAGQLLTGSFMDYLLPTACEVPRMTIEHQSAGKPGNALGVKGVGESGAIPSPAVIVAAIEDALQPFGVALSEVPLSEHRLFRPLPPARTASRNKG